MINQACIATLADIREELRIVDPTITASSDFLRVAAPAISARIEAITGREFFPRITTLYMDAIGRHIDAYTGVLTLSQPLLSVTSVTVGGTAWVAGTDYRAIPRDGSTPITGLRIIPSSGKTWGTYTTDWQESIVIVGVTGFRRAYGGYESAYYGAGETLPTGGINSSVGFWTATDPNGLDALRQSPRFSAGQLFRIESELLIALDVDYSTKKVYVQRGAHGSTPATHAAGTAIDIWQPEPQAVRAATRWASYVYKRRGHFNLSATEPDGITISTFPQDAPQEVTNILNELTDHSWGVT